MKKKKFDAVGWKSYCSRLYGGAGRWGLGAGRWVLGAGRWAARRVRAGRAGPARLVSVSGRGAHGAWGV